MNCWDMCPCSLTETFAIFHRFVFFSMSAILVMFRHSLLNDFNILETCIFFCIGLCLQEIGLASLGASEEDVLKLARCYWHSVEFGLCREDGKAKAYGAGLLSSFGELEYACKERGKNDDNSKVEHDGMPYCPEIKPWDPVVAAAQDFPITSYQPVYFLAESLQDAKLKMRKYCRELGRPFFAMYNAQTETVHIDRPVRRALGVPKSESE